ncbi:DinB family protein [Bacillus sp. AFS055030]|uniref:DinB family protein n=1 Tax=Bacillus sp. AFS055030 TaxID=2033507 RepID=UPI000BFE2042|nr:DinB family protein [Bacillus sp. AFS055030]PGL71006.1 hypothetical protein CN925_09115 [Bacillus sp. AFS055030]
MNETFVFQLLSKKYKKLLDLLKKCPENQRDVIPEGFKNNIHWQFGHILYSTDYFVLGLSGNKRMLPDSYQTFFSYGTKPIEWNDEPPEWNVLIEQLKGQIDSIYDILNGQLNKHVEENFLNANTIGELLVYNISHVSEHIGVIITLLKILN